MAAKLATSNGWTILLAPSLRGSNQGDLVIEPVGNKKKGRQLSIKSPKGYKIVAVTEGDPKSGYFTSFCLLKDTAQTETPDKPTKK